MRTFHWHKWKHAKGTVYLLHDRPWHQDTDRRATGEIAIVHRLSDKKWHASFLQDGWFCATGGPQKARRLLEEHLCRKSIGLFGEDALRFKPIIEGMPF